MNPVRIYTKRGCPYSRRAKELLDSYHVTYQEIDVTDDPRLKQQMIREANGADTTPQIFVSGRLIGGSDQLQDLERMGRLGSVLGEDEAPPQFI